MVTDYEAIKEVFVFSKVSQAAMALVTVMQLTGCAAMLQEMYYSTPSQDGYSQICASWEGGSVNNLLRQWGPPSQTTPMPNGNTIYTWTSGSSYVTDTNMTTTYNQYTNTYETRQTGGDVVESWCSTSFEVDDEGTIVYWQAKGNACLARPPRP